MKRDGSFLKIYRKWRRPINCRPTWADRISKHSLECLG
jgi:hypothetical protein